MHNYSKVYYRKEPLIARKSPKVINRVKLFRYKLFLCALYLLALHTVLKHLFGAKNTLKMFLLFVKIEKINISKMYEKPIEDC